MKRTTLLGITAAMVMAASWSYGQTQDNHEEPNAFPQVPTFQESSVPAGYRLTVELLTKEALSTAEALCRTGKYAEAAYLLNKVLQLNPNNPAIRQTLARIRQSSREAQAMADLQAFLQQWRRQTQQQEWTSSTTQAVSRTSSTPSGGCCHAKVGLIPAMPTAHPEEETKECEHGSASCCHQGRSQCCRDQSNVQTESCDCCCRCCQERTTVITGPVARRHRIVFVPEELLRACPALQRHYTVGVDAVAGGCCCSRQSAQAQRAIVIAVSHDTPHPQPNPAAPPHGGTTQRRATLAPVGFVPPPQGVKVIYLATPRPQPPAPMVNSRHGSTYIIVVPVTTQRTQDR